MQRRRFLRSLLGTTAGFAGLSLFPSLCPAQDSKPQIALTIDDTKTNLGPRMKWQDANAHMLSALDAIDLRAALFVCGMRVDSADGQRLVKEWDKAGHIIGNHSYSHKMYLKHVSYEEYAADFAKNHPLVAKFDNFNRLFRYPFLKEGDTAEKRDKF